MVLDWQSCLKESSFTILETFFGFADRKRYILSTLRLNTFDGESHSIQGPETVAFGRLRYSSRE